MAWLLILRQEIIKGSHAVSNYVVTSLHVMWRTREYRNVLVPAELDLDRFAEHGA